MTTVSGRPHSRPIGFSIAVIRELRRTLAYFVTRDTCHPFAIEAHRNDSGEPRELHQQVTAPVPERLPTPFLACGIYRL